MDRNYFEEREAQFKAENNVANTMQFLTELVPYSSALRN